MSDLISRSALKKALDELFKSGGYDSGLVMNIIDNAPTVELFCSYLSDGEVRQPCGEWIGIEEYDDYPNKKVCECSECGKMISISHNDFPNFCENCGADMRGKNSGN